MITEELLGLFKEKLRKIMAGQQRQKCWKPVGFDGKWFIT